MLDGPSALLTLICRVVVVRTLATKFVLVTLRSMRPCCLRDRLGPWAGLKVAGRRMTLVNAVVLIRARLVVGPSKQWWEVVLMLQVFVLKHMTPRHPLRTRLPAQ